jgi:hypothetical protein
MNKIRFIFYGIGRGLGISMPSIHSKLLSPSKQYFNSITCHHLIQNEYEISNSRSGDFGLINDIPNETFLTKPIRINFNPKNDEPSIFQKVTRSKCMHGDAHKSSINLVKQLNLLNYASKKIESDEIVVLCRDDIYFNYFDDEIFNKAKLLKDNEFIVARFDWQNGINDRFLIAKGRTAKILAKRIHFIERLISKDSGINGERLMLLCSKIFKLQPLIFNIKFSRVRLNNTILKERNFLPINRPYELFRIFISLLYTIQVNLRKSK